jgi:hypothetical protein
MQPAAGSRWTSGLVWCDANARHGPLPAGHGVRAVRARRGPERAGRVDGHKYQSTPEERLSIVGGKRAPQFYMPSYEAEIPENQRKDSE